MAQKHNSLPETGFFGRLTFRYKISPDKFGFMRPLPPQKARDFFASFNNRTGKGGK